MRIPEVAPKKFKKDIAISAQYGLIVFIGAICAPIAGLKPTLKHLKKSIMKICNLLLASAVAAGISSVQAQMTPFVTDNFTDNQVGVTTSPGTITPDFARSGGIWTVNSGSFASDGSSVNSNPIAGELNFGTSTEAEISLDFGTGIQAGDMEIQFDLRQANGSTSLDRFNFELTDNASNTYLVVMSPNDARWGTAPNQSGFVSVIDGTLGVGEAGASLTTSSQTITLSFNQTTGFELSSSAYGSPVLSFGNEHSSSYIQSMRLNNREANISWFVDDVSVQAVPEPLSSALMLGLGAVAAVMLLRRRRA